MSVKIDLSKFKHVSSDDKSTTLKHKDGHELKIAHGKMSKEFQAQLDALKGQTKEAPEKLAEGGLVDKAGKALDDLADRVSGEKYPTPKGHRGPASEPVKQENIDKYGFKQAFADGGIIDPAPTVADALKFDPTKETHSATPPEERFETIKADPELDRIATAGQMFDMGTKLPPEAKETMAIDQMAKENQDINAQAAWRGVDASKDASMAAQQEAQMNEKRQAAGLAPMATQGTATPQAAAVMPTEQPQPSQAAAQPLGAQAMGDTESMLMGGYNKQVAGINAAAQAQGDLGKVQAQMLKDQAAQQSEAKAAYDTHFGELTKERDAFIQDIKDGHVDPNKFWTGDSKTGEGGHSKIMAGIGMILAGFNPTGGPNAAVEFLNKQMDRDLKGQQSNLDSKQSLLRANLQQFGNLKDATDMTRAMQKDMVATQLQQAAATATSPMAKAAALQAAGKLQMEAAPMMQQFAMRRAMMNLANDPSGPKDGAIQQMISYKRAMGDHAGAKELEDHYVPGVGYSPTQAIPQDVRSQLIMRNNFDQMAKKYYDFAQKNSGSLNPKTIAEGKTLAAELQGAFRQATNGGVFKEGEQSFIEKLVPDNPSQFLADVRTLPKIKTLIDTNSQQLNSTKSTYGLPVTKTINGVNYRQIAPGKWQKVN